MTDKSSKQKLTFKRVATAQHALLSGKSVLDIPAEMQNGIFLILPGQVSNIHHDSA